MSARQFTVSVRCTITKIVTCEGCTEEQARNDPFSYAVDEHEADQIDYEVLDVTEDRA